MNTIVDTLRNRRNRRKHHRRVTPEAFRAMYAPGNLDFLQHFDALPRDRPLMLLLHMRVSTYDQRRGANLRRRYKWLKKTVRAMGFKSWYGVCFERCSGTHIDLASRPKLFATFESARQLQADHPECLVVVLTDARNRFLRGTDYNGRAETDTPTLAQCEAFGALAAGVTVATLLKPDAPFGEVRSHETRVAQEIGDVDKKPGRPRKEPRKAKKKINDLLKPKVRALARQGVPNREIARLLGLPESTIRSWVGPRSFAVRA